MVLLTGNGVVTVMLELNVELIVCVVLIVEVVLDTVLVEKVEIPLGPVPELGKQLEV